MSLSANTSPQRRYLGHVSAVQLFSNHFKHPPTKLTCVKALVYRGAKSVRLNKTNESRKINLRLVWDNFSIRRCFISGFLLNPHWGYFLFSSIILVPKMLFINWIFCKIKLKNKVNFSEQLSHTLGFAKISVVKCLNINVHHNAQCSMSLILSYTLEWITTLFIAADDASRHFYVNCVIWLSNFADLFNAYTCADYFRQ